MTMPLQRRRDRRTTDGTTSRLPLPATKPDAERLATPAIPAARDDADGARHEHPVRAKALEVLAHCMANGTLGG